jgi:hypothetical protein
MCGVRSLICYPLETRATQRSEKAPHLFGFTLRESPDGRLDPAEQRRLDLLARRRSATRPQRHLRRGHDLRLDTARVEHDVHETLGCGTLG